MNSEQDSRYDWTRLNHIQVGKYCEYFVKMEFVLYGFDVYTSEVDDRGIDFVVRKAANRYYDIQVKSSRGFNYIFFRKSCFQLSDNLYAAVVYLFPKQPPALYLIPSIVWRSPSSCFVSRDYLGKKSDPEWGLQITAKSYRSLEQYSFSTVANLL